MSALMWVILGMVLGGAASLAWCHRRDRPVPMLQVVNAVDPLLPLDTHLVLNVLNRFAIQLTDEHLQDGLEALGQYLANNARDAKPAGVPPGELGKSLECYWRLTEWQHQKAAAVWQQTGPWPEDLHQRIALINALKRALQSVEGVAADSIALQAQPPTQPSQPWGAEIRLQPHGTSSPLDSGHTRWATGQQGDRIARI